MKQHTLILVSICVFTFLAKAEPPKGFSALFNGKNLDGWNAKPNGWAVENGILTRKPKSGYIWTEKAYGDFILDVEVKVSKRCNSGIFFRTDPKNAVQGGFEIQVMDTTGKKKLGKHDNGAFYDALAPSANPAKPLGEWNRFVIACNGPNISVSINGTEVVKADLDKWTTGNKNPDGSRNKFKTALKDLPRKGHIGFQDHGQDVWYRNIYLKSLN
ncbi:MAG: DUF1080 domain-containing protein [Verrucomicrobiota bacterium]|jgi:hypothetical protein|nr:DUF1080 domain-containing protein [Verrucomicrobiota bacterium]